MLEIPLDYVMYSLLGEPVKKGKSPKWKCPKCGKKALCRMPRKAEFKDRCWCFGCKLHTNEMGLIKLCFPGEGPGARNKMIIRLRKEFQARYANR